MKLPFSPQTAQKLEAWLNQAHPSRTVAVFDWDNTVIWNDIGEAVFWYMLRHNLIPWRDDWQATSPFLTDVAVTRLEELSQKSGAGTLSTRENRALCELFLSLYHEGRLPESQSPSWRNTYQPALMYPPYAWILQLCAGLTMESLKEIALAAINEALFAPVGSHWELGYRQVPAFIRFRDPVVRLMGHLQSQGVEVWVCSASAQPIVEPFAEKLDLPVARIIGMRPALDAKERILPLFESCGGYENPTHEIITFRQGKRGWINKLIFNQPEGPQQLTTPAPIQLAVGDSDGDEFLFRDAQELRLVIQEKNHTLPHVASGPLDASWAIEQTESL